MSRIAWGRCDVAPFRMRGVYAIQSRSDFDGWLAKQAARNP
ncbi:MAG: hypothetical protein ACRD2N_26295 [Vicinamibacterales bacterium]